jgi:hypothetical protein
VVFVLLFQFSEHGFFLTSQSIDFLPELFLLLRCLGFEIAIGFD